MRGCATKVIEETFGFSVMMSDVLLSAAVGGSPYDTPIGHGEAGTRGPQLDVDISLHVVEPSNGGLDGWIPATATAPGTLFGISRTTNPGQGLQSAAAMRLEQPRSYTGDEMREAIERAVAAMIYPWV